MLKVMVMTRTMVHQTPKAILALQILHRANDVGAFGEANAGEREGGGEHGAEHADGGGDNVRAVVVPRRQHAPILPFPGRPRSTLVFHQRFCTLRR